VGRAAVQPGEERALRSRLAQLEAQRAALEQAAVLRLSLTGGWVR
jgi:hypothetical protein